MRTSFDMSTVERVYAGLEERRDAVAKQIAELKALQQQSQERTCQAVMHFAAALMANDPTSTLSDVQRDWLRGRCQAQDGHWEPFSPHEQRKLVPVLLAWSAGTVWQDALISGLRGVVANELLPEVKK